MRNRAIAAACLGLLTLLPSLTSRAQTAPRAHWIWFDEGDPLESAPSGTRYFRISYAESYELADAEMHIACDNEFVLFVNGKEAGRSSEWKDGKVLDVKRFLHTGKNTIAVEATNRGGPAGLVAWLVRRTIPGNQYTMVTDASWKSAAEAPDNWRETSFDDAKWAAVKVLEELGKVDQWQEITWNGKADPGRFHAPNGFVVELVADPDLTGSIVNMTFDCKGRPVISRERGPILILEDEDGDGKYDKTKTYTDRVTNCQGILAYDADTYYLVGDGPDGTGLYRLRDTDGDDTADEVELIHKTRGGMGEHGPHAIIAGPDGYLYLAVGNHAGATATVGSDSPVEKQYEADVLPKYEDANGHAVGIKVPCGTIWRLDPDGKHFTLEAAGFRNHYDIAFNSLEELFTYDSDMEWDEFLPWYRPVRMCHCPPGGEFGSRSGSNPWPAYYADSLPPTLDTGRGSPCGVVFYNHRQYPARYRDAFFMTDWSYGRIFAVRLERDGASFQADSEEFVTGKPLNVTDIEVGPDGSVFFSTGGRGTEGGVYRIRYTGAAEEKRSEPRDESPVAAALEQPQPQSAWGRETIRRHKAEAGEAWGPGLEAAAKKSDAHTARRLRALSYLMQFGPEPSTDLPRQLAKDKDPEIRAAAAVLLARHPAADVAPDLATLLADPSGIVERRALEGFIRTGAKAPLKKLLPLLASQDRFVRFTARLALERIDPAEWRETVFKHDNPRVVVMGLVALNKLGLVARDSAVAEAALARELNLLEDGDWQDSLDTLRGIELTLVNTKPEERPKSAERIGELLLDRFPTGDQDHDRELSRLLAALNPPGAIEKLLSNLEDIGETNDVGQRADAIHYARCLVAIADGWTLEQRYRYFAWFDTSRDWKGGHSYPGYVANFLRDAVGQLSEPDRLSLVSTASKLPRAAGRAVERINDKSDAAFLPVLRALVESDDPPPVPRGDVLAALGRTGRAEAEAILLRAYERVPEDRDAAVRALANFPNTRNWTLFARALDSENRETVRASLQALTAIDHKPDAPAAYRAAIQAAGRLGDQGAWDGIVLLRQWGGKHFGHPKSEWKAELKAWQKWYAETYPDAPSAQLAEETKPTQNWTYDQLLVFLEGDAGKGSADTGRSLFEKAVCAKCHRLGSVGTGLGPDLTTLASRFKRKDILEAIVYPSRVIPDQYKSYLVATKDGRVINAMKAPDDGDNLVLLLSDASTLKLPKNEVDEIVEGKQSVMPDGLLNPLSLKEIADLFAFLESGTPADATAATGKK